MGGKRAKFLRKAKASVQEALKSRDMLLSSVTKSIDDLDKTINLLGERLEDWYGVYFPELRMDDKIKYSEAVLIVERDSLDMKELSSLVGQKKAEEIKSKAGSTLGAKISDDDLAECRSLASTIIQLGKLRMRHEAYQQKIAMELVPNMSEVGGPEVAAKLVAHVGSLQKLALLPASAFQVMGAEKALFKHLKNRKVPPPKHGIIFQHAKISSSPKRVRGKIARALANKLCLAAKADAFSKNSIGAKLKADFEKRYNTVMEEYKKKKSSE